MANRIEVAKVDEKKRKPPTQLAEFVQVDCEKENTIEEAVRSGGKPRVHDLAFIEARIHPVIAERGRRFYARGPGWDAFCRTVRRRIQQSASRSRSGSRIIARKPYFEVPARRGRWATDTS